MGGWVKRKKSREGGGVDWRGREEALDKHDFFLLTACYLLAGEGLDFPMS